MDKAGRRRYSKYQVAYNPDYHPDDLLDKMSKGLTNVEIMADWNISEPCFYKWIKDHEEFAEAYELGKPKWETTWIKKGETNALSGNREYFKFWNRVMAVKASKGWKEEKGSTNVNIGKITQVNNYEGKSEAELAEILQTKLEKLKIPTNIIEADYKLIEEKKESNDESEQT